MTHQRRRGALIALFTTALLSLPMAQAAQAAGGPCDPPAFCPAGVVPFDGPNGPSGNTKPVAPTPTKQQPPSSQKDGAQVSNPQTSSPASAAAGPSLKVIPGTAAPGAQIVVSGSGWSDNGRSYNVFLNVRDSKGVGFDTRSKEIKCVETDDVVLVFLQMFGIGCSADAGGPIIHTDNKGNFRASVTVPTGIAPGNGQVCGNSPVIYESCTPFIIDVAGPPPADTPQPQAAPAVDSSTTAAIQQAIQSFDDMQAQAIAAQDPTLMANVVPSDVAQSVVQSTQQNLDDGVVGAQLQQLQWGPITVNGGSAQAADSEAWTLTWADGSVSTQSFNWSISLVLDDGIWKVHSMATQ